MFTAHSTLRRSLLGIGATLLASATAFGGKYGEGISEPSSENIMVFTSDGHMTAIGLDEENGDYFIAEGVTKEMLEEAWEYKGPIAHNPLAENASAAGNVTDFGLTAPLTLESGSLEKAVMQLTTSVVDVSFEIHLKANVKLKNGCRVYFEIDLTVNTGGDGALAQIIKALRGKKSNSSWNGTGHIGFAIYCPPNSPTSGESEGSFDLNVSASQSGDSVCAQIAEAIQAAVE